MKKFYAIMLAIGFLAMGALEANGSGVGAPPRFTSGSSGEYTVNSGETVQFFLYYSGDQPISVKVAYNGKEIKFPNKWSRLIVNDDLIIFIINVVDKSDAGDYTFTLYNSSGMASTTVKLNVE